MCRCLNIKTRQVVVQGDSNIVLEGMTRWTVLKRSISFAWSIYFITSEFGMFWILRKQKRWERITKHLKKYFLPHEQQRYSFCFSATHPELDGSQSLVLKTHTHTHKCLYDRVILFVLSSIWSRRCSVSRGPGLFLSLKGICFSFLFSFSHVWKSKHIWKPLKEVPFSN